MRLPANSNASSLEVGPPFAMAAPPHRVDAANAQADDLELGTWTEIVAASDSFYSSLLPIFVLKHNWWNSPTFREPCMGRLIEVSSSRGKRCVASAAVLQTIWFDRGSCFSDFQKLYLVLFFFPCVFSTCVSDWKRFQFYLKPSVFWHIEI